MGINVEFNPELTLRNYAEFVKGDKKKEECLPEGLKKGEYQFLKKGFRAYYLKSLVSLCETKGKGDISDKLADVRIIEVTHFLKDNEEYTRGTYRIT